MQQIHGSPKSLKRSLSLAAHILTLSIFSSQFALAEDDYFVRQQQENRLQEQRMQEQRFQEQRIQQQQLESRRVEQQIQTRQVEQRRVDGERVERQRVERERDDADYERQQRDRRQANEKEVDDLRRRNQAVQQQLFAGALPKVALSSQKTASSCRVLPLPRKQTASVKSTGYFAANPLPRLQAALFLGDKGQQTPMLAVVVPLKADHHADQVEIVSPSAKLFVPVGGDDMQTFRSVSGQIHLLKHVPDSDRGLFQVQLRDLTLYEETNAFPQGDPSSCWVIRGATLKAAWSPTEVKASIQ